MSCQGERGYIGTYGTPITTKLYIDMFALLRYLAVRTTSRSVLDI